MRRLVAINLKNGDGYFYLEQLEGDTMPDGFSCAIAEYDDYLSFHGR